MHCVNNITRHIYNQYRYNCRGNGLKESLVNPNVGAFNVCGCSTKVENKSEISKMSLRKNLDVCAQSETKLKGNCESVGGRVSGFGGREGEQSGGAAGALVVAQVCCGMEGGVIQAFEG